MAADLSSSQKIYKHNDNTTVPSVNGSNTSSSASSKPKTATDNSGANDNKHVGNKTTTAGQQQRHTPQPPNDSSKGVDSAPTKIRPGNHGESKSAQQQQQQQRPHSPHPLKTSDNSHSKDSEAQTTESQKHYSKQQQHDGRSENPGLKSNNNTSNHHRTSTNNDEETAVMNNTDAFFRTKRGSCTRCESLPCAECCHSFQNIKDTLLSMLHKQHIQIDRYCMNSYSLQFNTLKKNGDIKVELYRRCCAKHRARSISSFTINTCCRQHKQETLERIVQALKDNYKSLPTPNDAIASPVDPIPFSDKTSRATATSTRTQDG
jgi:hypothetical protein